MSAMSVSGGSGGVITEEKKIVALLTELLEFSHIAHAQQCARLDRLVDLAEELAGKKPPLRAVEGKRET